MIVNTSRAQGQDHPPCALHVTCNQHARKEDTMVHVRKQNGNARRLAKRATRPNRRDCLASPPASPPVYVPHGTSCQSASTRRARQVIDAWDNTSTVGETIYWRNGYTHLRTMARRSGTHVHDGPVAHDVRPIDGNTVHNTASRSAREFVRQLRIEHNS
jgi:hypothetical protein